MKVSEAIEQLKKLPQDARLFHLWDGEPRTEINLIWVSKKGHVVTSDYDQVCYSDAARPVSAPNAQELKVWHSIKNPNRISEDDDFERFYPWG